MFPNNKKGGDYDYPKHELLGPVNASVMLNPLSMFPNRRDALTKTFISVASLNQQSHNGSDGKMNKGGNNERLSEQRWLDPEKVDPEFGIKVSSI